MTVDNGFRLYSGLPGGSLTLIGSGNDWTETYSFSTDASEGLTIRAREFHPGSPSGIILSTSEGLISDHHWKCVPDTGGNLPDINTWPNALELGINGVATWPTPWGFKEGIDSNAYWIWSQEEALAVVCYKKLDQGRCSCCPPFTDPKACNNTAECKNAGGQCRNPNLPIPDIYVPIDKPCTKGQNCRCYKPLIQVN